MRTFERTETRRHCELKMEIPTLGQFKILLAEDKPFRDYLNAFLNLPIFCRRFTYDTERKSFKVDPPLKSPYHLIREAAVLSWIHGQRLPLFWNSHLYHEYKLCQGLSRDNNSLSCSESGLLAGIAGMNHFRRFLFGTEGEAAWLFWLDVQYLLHTVETEAWMVPRIISRIHDIYLRNGAPFCLNDDIRRELLTQYCSTNRDSSSKNSQVFQHNSTEHLTFSKQIKACICAQQLVLENLRGYWCRKYMIHLQRSLLKPQRTISRVVNSDSTIRKQSSISVSLPHIIRDEGQTNDHQKSQRQPHIKLAPCKLPDISREHSFKRKTTLTVGRSEERIRLNPFITASTSNFFSCSNSPSSHLCNVSQGLKKDYFHLHPFLNASLRADSLAGNPLVIHFSKTHHDNVALNYLLFWQSVEVMFIQDEMRRWYQSRKGRSRRHSNVKQCRYVGYLEFYPAAKNPKELVKLFLRAGAQCRIELPPQVREELIMLLPKGLGHSLLVSVQEFAAEQLLWPWKEFLSHDNQEFLKRCTTQRLLTQLSSQHRKEHLSIANAPFSPTQVAEHTYGCSRLKGMWESLRLAETAKYPGISYLPSRKQRDITLLNEREELEGEAEEVENIQENIRAIDLTGIALNPVVTTVYQFTRRQPKRFQHEILTITKPIHSREHKKTPTIPKSFRELLKDPEHMEHFHSFLMEQGSGSEMQLLFWLAVEDMKSSISNKRACTAKMRRIFKRFFCNNGAAEKVLRCPDPILAELSSQQKANPFQLLAAQMAVGEAMEKQWFGRYIAYLTAGEDEPEEKDTEKKEDKKPVCREHTIGLWGYFAHNVISFRRGLMNPTTAEEFKAYLKEEVVKGSSGSYKKVIGTKVVYVTKLLNDLSFWAEVERYKDLADIVNATKSSGHHTPEDDIMVHKKAHAIINCYIDSAVYPRVQINIPNDLVQYILDCVSQGQITRGLFHEAALNIFSVLIHYWKRFCMTRFSPGHRKPRAELGEVVESHSSHHHHTHHTHHTHHRHHLTSLLHQDSRIFTETGPILSFSLLGGLRWIQPLYRQTFAQLDMPTRPPPAPSTPPTAHGNSTPGHTPLPDPLPVVANST